jgi:type IV pilus assembly protein PilB
LGNGKFKFGDAFKKISFEETPEENSEKKAFVETRTKEEIYKGLGIKFVDLTSYIVDDDAVALITDDVARRYSVIPIGYDENRPDSLVLAMENPMDVEVVDDLKVILNKPIIPVAVDTSQLMLLIDKYFGRAAAQAVAEEYRKEFSSDIDAKGIAADSAVEDAPVVQLVKGIIEQAVHRRASDIHIEPLERGVRLRYRVDGVLVEIMKYDHSLLNVIVSRVKIISGLDISEKRMPQDGRATAIVDGREFDIRVSTLPTVYGEKVVMRLNEKKTMQLEKGRLGITGKELQDFDKMLGHPHGIILVTGPTGSGKSTTLYTALSELNVEGVNIITVEDPVEVNIAGINQVQVNEKAGLSFASALRSILRQDPDIIMIGEIRDTETAAIAVQAAITGHLVVSTLHTNSTAATIDRLVDMGVEPYLVADSIVGIVAQRLARRLCVHCKEAYEATDAEKAELGLDVTKPYTLYRHKGCGRCDGTGYFGRIGIFETMDMTPEMRNLIAKKGSTNEVRKLSIEQGTHTLLYGYKKLVKDGITSMTELHRAEYSEE